MRRYLVDVAVPGGARDWTDRLRGGWDEQVGAAIPLPPAAPVGLADYRIRIMHSKVDQAVVENIYSDGVQGATGGAFNHLNDRVVLHVVHRGEWSFEGQKRSSAMTRARQGTFIARYNDPAWRFGIEPHTSATVVILPAAPLEPLLRDRSVTGPADSAELRVLMSYVRMVQDDLEDLSAPGLRAAAAALAELTAGVLARGVDVGEPSLASALASAARELADEHLTDPDLSPATLAARLNVSVRTLQRAFGTGPESPTEYVRRRRLERARADLAAGHMTVAEIAARWQFSDSSHLVRHFRRQYGLSPTQYVRSLTDTTAPR